MRLTGDSRRGACVTISMLLSALACGGGAPATGAGGDGWVVQRSTDDDGVTHVRNVSGSKWGADATMVEELSIGVLEGAEEYMLAQPFGVWLTDDAIFVVDRQDHHVRVYDYEGTFVCEFGKQGQGPGELENPMGIVVVGDRVFVGCGTASGRISVFALDGLHVEDWSLGSNPAFQLFAAGDDLFVRRFIRPENPGDVFERPQAIQSVGPEGLIGEPLLIPDLGSPTTVGITMMGREFPVPVPLAPRDEIWSVSPSGDLVVGFADRYRFEVRTLDGTLKTVVERAWEPVPVQPGEAEAARTMFVSAMQRQLPDFEWNGAEIPATKPAYELLAAHRDGRIWVLRSGAATEDPDCDPAADDAPGLRRSCWQAESIADLFGMDGSYLGRVRGPSGGAVFPRDVHAGRVAVIAEEEGAPQVRIYRIVLPDGADEG